MKRLWGSTAGGITFIDKVQMGNKLMEESFREFVWQPHGFISSCFAAHR